jgi:hypothetical protein
MSDLKALSINWPFMIIILTIAILIFPVHLKLSYNPVEIAAIFENISLFALLYYVWLACLFLYAFLDRKKQSKVKYAFLTCIFASVFLGFTVVIDTGISPESFFHIAHAKYLAEYGRIPLGHPNLGYFSFPGLSTIVYTLSEVLGLGFVETSTFLVLVTQVTLFGTLLYLIFDNFLRNPYLSFISTILAVQGNMMFSRMNNLHPGSLGTFFLMVFILLLVRSRVSFLERPKEFIIFTILLSVTTITHFVGSITFFFILFGIFAASNLSKDKSLQVPLRYLFLSAFIPLLWEVYHSYTPFESIALLASRIVERLTALDFLTYPSVIIAANVGQAVPLWVRYTRLFWLFLILVPGTLIGLLYMFKLRKIGREDRVAGGGLTGIIILFIVATSMSNAGDQFYRLLMYAPFFTTPLLSKEISKQPPKRMVFPLLVASILALSFPTFLAHANPVCTFNFYPYEKQAILFLPKSFEDGYGLNFFLTNSMPYVMYYLPNVRSWSLPEPGLMLNETALWKSLDEKLDLFEKMEHTQRIFVFSNRLTNSFGHILGVLPTDPHWIDLKAKLSQESNGIYDSGYIQLFT